MPNNRQPYPPYPDVPEPERTVTSGASQAIQAEYYNEIHQALAGARPMQPRASEPQNWNPALLERSVELKRLEAEKAERQLKAVEAIKLTQYAAVEQRKDIESILTRIAARARDGEVVLLEYNITADVRRRLSELGYYIRAELRRGQSGIEYQISWSDDPDFCEYRG